MSRTYVDQQLAVHVGELVDSERVLLSKDEIWGLIDGRVRPDYRRQLFEIFDSMLPEGFELDMDERGGGGADYFELLP